MPDAMPGPVSLPDAFRTPRIRTLSALQSQFVLQRNHVGRLAFVSAGRVELIPIHYVFADGVIVGRTSCSSSLSAPRADGDVVFEVDEPDRLFEWRSVVVRGTLRMLPPPAISEERHTYWSMISAFRTLVPDAFTERDPTPSRRVLFTIDPSEITGREASASFLSRSRPDTPESNHGDHI